MTQEQYDLERMRAWAMFTASQVQATFERDISVKAVVENADLILQEFDSRFSPNQGKKEEGE